MFFASTGDSYWNSARTRSSVSDGRVTLPITGAHLHLSAMGSRQAAALSSPLSAS